MNPDQLFPELKDIKPPVETEPSLWPWVIGGTAVVLVVVIVLLMWGRRKFQKAAKALTPQEEAYAEIDKLKLEKLTSRKDLDAYHFRLSNILRTFLQRRYGLNALDMTTEEFAGVLAQRTDVPDVIKQDILEILNQCDLVKFAQGIPESGESLKAVERVRALIRDIK